MEQTCDRELFSAEELVRRLGQILSGVRACRPIPEDIDRLIKDAYLAGEMTEEGNAVRFRIVISDELRKDRMQLIAPVIIDADTLRKQALAIDPSFSCLLAALDEARRWRLVGLDGRRELLHGLSEGLNAYQVVVNGPGQIHAALGTKVVAYDRGRYFSPNGEEVVRKHLPDGAVDALARYVSEPDDQPIRIIPDLRQGLVTPGRGGFFFNPEQWKKHGDAFRRKVRNGLDGVLAGGICNLIDEARRLQRGAGMLFLAAGQASGDTQNRP